MAEVVNIRKSAYDVLIARPSKWGNPFQIGRDGNRERVIKMYEVHIRRRPDLIRRLARVGRQAPGLLLQAGGLSWRCARQTAPRIPPEPRLDMSKDRHGGQSFDNRLAHLLRCA